MVETIRIKEWNINQRSGYSGDKIPDWIVGELFPKDKGKPDIIVLTEFFKTSNWREISDFICKMGYTQHITGNSIDNQNDVVIFAVDDMKLGEELSLKTTYGNNNPNFIFLKLRKGEMWFGIAGVRIRPGGYYCTVCGARIDRDVVRLPGSLSGECKKCERVTPLRSTYPKCAAQNSVIITPCKIRSKEYPVFVIGDFNTLRRGTPEQDWNIKKLKDEWAKEGFTVFTPKGSSWKKDSKCEFPNDQFIFGGIKIDKRDIKAEYDWSFINRHDVYNDSNDRRKDDPPYPDHAILNVEITINKE